MPLNLRAAFPNSFNEIHNDSCHHQHLASTCQHLLIPVNKNMADAPSAPSSTVPPASNAPESSPANTTAALEQILSLLSSRDDTSRFVGLALLKSLLDNHEALRSDPDITAKCWAAVPASFLDRLLRSNTSISGNEAAEKSARSVEETSNMVDLAVGVIHSFTLLLGSVGSDAKLAGRTPALVAVLGRREEGAEKGWERVLYSGTREGRNSAWRSRWLEDEQVEKHVDYCIKASQEACLYRELSVILLTSRLGLL